MRDGIGEYYERIERERREAVGKLLAAVKRYEEDPCYTNYAAMVEAREAATEAGNTGD